MGITVTAEGAPAFYSVKGLAEALGGGITEQTIYAAIRSGAIPATRIGKRLLVPASFLEELAEEAKTAGNP